MQHVQRASHCVYIPRPLVPLGTGHPVCLPVGLGCQPSEHTHTHTHWVTSLPPPGSALISSHCKNRTFGSPASPLTTSSSSTAGCSCPRCVSLCWAGAAGSSSSSSTASSSSSSVTLCCGRSSSASSNSSSPWLLGSSSGSSSPSTAPWRGKDHSETTQSVSEEER